MDVFIPPIIERLEKDLPGLQLAKQDVISFMDLCPFETMASPTGALSPFCYIFSKKEWRQYDYYESLGKCTVTAMAILSVQQMELVS